MNKKRKASLRVQLTSSREDEVAFIEHLNLLRSNKNSDVPNFILKMAMLGVSMGRNTDFANEPSDVGVGGVTQNSALDLSDVQLKELAKNIAIEIKKLNITEGVNQILSGSDAESANNGELPEVEQEEDEAIKSLKGSKFF